MDIMAVDVTTKLLTVGEVARLARVPARVIFRDIELHELGAIKVGARALRIVPSEARRYMRDALGCDDAQLKALACATVQVSLNYLVPIATMATVLSTTSQHVRDLVRRADLCVRLEGPRAYFTREQAWAFLMRLDRTGRLGPPPFRRRLAMGVSSSV